MKRSIAIIFLTLSLACSGQKGYNSLKISRQTKEIVSKIIEGKHLMGSAIGYGGVRPDQYNNLIELQKKATKAELTELTDHPNGVVRCYAFWALSYDSTASLLPIVIGHLNDTTLVYTVFGCIGGQEKAGDLFIDFITQSISPQSRKLTGVEYRYLDSLLIYTPNKLYARDKAIARASLSETFYKRVRELVLKENNQSALVALAKFKRKQDIPLILKNSSIDGYRGLFYTYKAISEFPDPVFRPFLNTSLQDALKQGARDIQCRELYAAIASFKDDTAYQLLKEPFTKIKDEDRKRRSHIELIFGAIRAHYSPIYIDLLWDIWENEHKITPDIYEQLCQQDPERAFLLTRKTIQHINDFYDLDIPEFIEEDTPSVNLPGIMFDAIITRDRHLAVSLVSNCIREVNVHMFDICADQVLKLKAKPCVDALFARLEKESNPYVYLKASEVLMAFGDENINRKIVELSKRNANMTRDWGGEAFSKLLKEHNVKY